MGNKTQTYEVLVENIIMANCLDFLHAMATMLATYIFDVSRDKPVDATVFFSSRNIHMNDETPTPQKVRSLMN